jgi:hypothetical protein
LFTGFCIGFLIMIPSWITLADELSQEPIIYSVYQPLSMGDPGELVMKDYFVNVGTKNGVKQGSRLDVFRRKPSYDLQARKLEKDITFPIASLRVIHAENSVAVARLEKMAPEAITPSIVPRAVMVGDLVKLTR